MYQDGEIVTALLSNNFFMCIHVFMLMHLPSNTVSFTSDYMLALSVYSNLRTFFCRKSGEPTRSGLVQDTQTTFYTCSNDLYRPDRDFGRHRRYRWNREGMGYRGWLRHTHIPGT